MVLPVAVAARASGRFRVTFCVTSWLDDVAPWVSRRLAEHGFVPQVVGRKHLQAGPRPALQSFDVLLTASESTAAPHRFVHALVQRANERGLLTCTMQHGLENLGLTSIEDGDHEFASKLIFTWGPPEALPDWVPAARRNRCVGVGRAQLPGACAKPLPPELHGLFVAVFENLHWDRYPSGFGERFLADLAAAARAYPRLTFVIRPHPAGLWLARNREALADGPTNLILADPVDERWGNLSARDLVSQAVAVMTTPSTVALDAAIEGTPVAVAAYGLDLPAYAPLPLLQGAPDWNAFLDAALANAPELATTLNAFRARQCIAGDACARILQALAPADRLAA